jgi:hypothetical protein
MSPAALCPRKGVSSDHITFDDDQREEDTPCQSKAGEEFLSPQITDWRSSREPEFVTGPALQEGFSHKAMAVTSMHFLTRQWP